MQISYPMGAEGKEMKTAIGIVLCGVLAMGCYVPMPLNKHGLPVGVKPARAHYKEVCTHDLSTYTWKCKHVRTYVE